MQKVCVPDMPYEDGARTLFLYTKGTEGNPSEELKQFLHYMECTTEENAVNPQLKKIHRMVEQVKRDEEVELALMKIWEDAEEIREQAREEERANTERERMRADAEKAKADAEKVKAEEANARADAAEKEIQALKKLLEQQKHT